jgi:RHS repeat-associated protein
MTAANGDYMTYTYDDAGNVTEKSNYSAEPAQTSWKGWSYAPQLVPGSLPGALPGKLLKETQATGDYTAYEYYNSGNVFTMTVVDVEQGGETPVQFTAYTYDVLGRLKTVAQMVDETTDAVTTYGYDAHGNLSSVIDAENQETTYEYDDLGRLVSTTSPDTGQTIYAYDEAGNLISKKDANGITVTYQYDDLNRLTHANFQDPNQNVIYSYDQGTNGLGHLTGFTDPSGSTTYGYDARGRLTQKTSVISGQSYPLSRTYTLGSRVTQLEYPTGRTVDFTRDATMKRITSTTTTMGQTTKTLVQGLTYNPFGGPAHMENGAGGVVNNQSGLCSCLVGANPDPNHEREDDMETSYSYDANRNLTGITTTHHPRLDRSFGYDALNRLTSATSYYETLQYEYDDVGNRTSRTKNISETDEYNYVSGTNQLDYIEYISSQTYIYFTHDWNGNITDKGNQHFDYDLSNRLVKAWLGEQPKAEYVYNALGQRVIKTAYVPTAVTTVFHYDFDGNIIGESEPDGDFTKEYLYMGSSRMAMVDVPSGDFYFYLNDHLGNPQYVTNAAGVVVWEARYLPFGQAIINGHSSVENNFRFPGQYYDSETGLHYNYHRYYDPKTGRYLTPDPIGQAGGINLYVYAVNNPITFSDPWGLRCKKNYWQRAWEGFKFTNEMVPGLLAPALVPPISIGLLTAGKMAEALDAITLAKWASGGFRGAILSGAAFTGLETGVVAIGTAAVNFAAVGVAWEAGVAIGSLINAAFMPCEEDDSECE